MIEEWKEIALESEKERNLLHEILDDNGAIMAGSLSDRIIDVIADRDAAIAERDAARVAARKFANTMTALIPRWTSEMDKAWSELFAVIDK